MWNRNRLPLQETIHHRSWSWPWHCLAFVNLFYSISFYLLTIRLLLSFDWPLINLLLISIFQSSSPDFPQPSLFLAGYLWSIQSASLRYTFLLILWRVRATRIWHWLHEVSAVSLLGMISCWSADLKKCGASCFHLILPPVEQRTLQYHCILLLYKYLYPFLIRNIVRLLPFSTKAQTLRLHSSHDEVHDRLLSLPDDHSYSSQNHPRPHPQLHSHS